MRVKKGWKVQLKKVKKEQKNCKVNLIKNRVD